LEFCFWLFNKVFSLLVLYFVFQQSFLGLELGDLSHLFGNVGFGLNVFQFRFLLGYLFFLNGVCLFLNLRSFRRDRSLFLGWFAINESRRG